MPPAVVRATTGGTESRVVKEPMTVLPVGNTSISGAGYQCSVGMRPRVKFDFGSPETSRKERANTDWAGADGTADERGQGKAAQARATAAPPGTLLVHPLT